MIKLLLMKSIYESFFGGKKIKFKHCHTFQGQIYISRFLFFFEKIQKKKYNKINLIENLR